MKTIVKIALFLFVMNNFLSCSKDDTPVAQVNEAPVISAQTFSAAENIADNLPIGTVEASDPEGDTLSYSISTNDNNLFEINDEGLLSLDDLQILDFETAESHTITVTVSDGTSTTEAMVTINVTDIEDSFVTIWETTSADETVTIPVNDAFTYDYTIDWGDGTIQTGVTGDASHPYDSPGTHTVSISGTFAAMRFNQDQLRSIERWGTIQWQTMERVFQNVPATLIINATDTPDLSQVTDMSRMFASSEFNQDISDWDVANVTNMNAMFSDSEFNQDISGWNVVNVADMGGMFSGSEFNQDISDWNVANVTNMGAMFWSSQFNQDISDWNVANVTSMASMFLNSEFNQDISDWNVANVISMFGMFRETPFNQDISDWNVVSVANCINFALNAPLTAANTPNFTNCTP